MPQNSEDDKRYKEVVAAFYKETVKTLQDGTQREIGYGCSVLAEQGQLLYDLARDLKPQNSLEVGLAWGGSAIHILCALEANGTGHHTALDPFQSSWSDIGVSEPTRLGLGDYLTCFYERSDVAMPRFIQEGRRFQFIFIDGDHRFDAAFVDFHFAQRLLDVGGILAFDDAQAMSVARTVSFVDTNMPNMKRMDVPTFGRFAVFRKEDEDRRLTGDEHPF